MRRISVIGSSGSGKTAFARRLSRSLDIPHVELDSLFWELGWSEATDEEFRERVAAKIAANSWIVDGNYRSKLGSLVWERADTIIWIDAPRWRTLTQVVARTVRRAATKEQLWNGNRESWRGLWVWRGDDSIVRWAWTSYRPTRERYALAMREAALGSGPDWYRLRTRRAVERFLTSVEH